MFRRRLSSAAETPSFWCRFEDEEERGRGEEGEVGEGGSESTSASAGVSFETEVFRVRDFLPSWAPFELMLFVRADGATMCES